MLDFPFKPGDLIQHSGPYQYPWWIWKGTDATTLELVDKESLAVVLQINEFKDNDFAFEVYMTINDSIYISCENFENWNKSWKLISRPDGKHV